MRYPKPLQDTFWNNCDRTTGYCWNWLRSLDKHGYGRITIKYKTYSAHRVSYLLYYGKPITKWILHKCDNRKCVNPLHLYEGDRQDNIKDLMIRKRHHGFKVTNCPKGHEYNSKNTRVYLGRRICKVCDRQRKIKIWKQ